MRYDNEIIPDWLGRALTADRETWHVDVGYFDTFTARVFAEIRHLERAEAMSEMPQAVRSALDAELPASIPGGTGEYFDKLEDRIYSRVNAADAESTASWHRDALRRIQALSPDAAKVWFEAFWTRTESSIETGHLAPDWLDETEVPGEDGVSDTEVPEWLASALLDSRKALARPTGVNRPTETGRDPRRSAPRYRRIFRLALSAAAVVAISLGLYFSNTSQENTDPVASHLEDVLERQELISGYSFGITPPMQVSTVAEVYSEWTPADASNDELEFILTTILQQGSQNE